MTTRLPAARASRGSVARPNARRTAAPAAIRRLLAETLDLEVIHPCLRGLRLARACRRRRLRGAGGRRLTEGRLGLVLQVRIVPVDVGGSGDAPEVEREVVR